MAKDSDNNDAIDDNEWELDKSDGTREASPENDPPEGKSRDVDKTGSPGSRPKKQGRPLTAENKEALEMGRMRSRWVDEYLKALETHKWQGRGVSEQDAGKLKEELASLDKELASLDGVKRLFALQRRADLASRIALIEGTDNFTKLKERFISVAKEFSIERKITYQIWRDMGVPVRTLTQAGLYPPRGKSDLDDDDTDITNDQRQSQPQDQS